MLADEKHDLIGFVHADLKSANPSMSAHTTFCTCEHELNAAEPITVSVSELSDAFAKAEGSQALMSCPILAAPGESIEEHMGDTASELTHDDVINNLAKAADSSAELVTEQMADLMKTENSGSAMEDAADTFGHCEHSIFEGRTLKAGVH